MDGQEILKLAQDMLNNPLGFESLEPGSTDAQKEALALQRQQNYEMALRFKRVFTSEDGAAIIRHLRDKTIEDSTFRASMGLLNGAAHGFAREGQNTIVRYIEDMIKAADALAKQLKQEAEANARGQSESE